MVWRRGGLIQPMQGGGIGEGLARDGRARKTLPFHCLSLSVDGGESHEISVMLKS